ncbi:MULTISPECIES: hypothetical protein [Dietzia]|uniref:Uncharacterized protein n=1 Tax=Dietzia maris TaxID=37915 RepID=A0A365P8R5_9ACTN|nr:MULTISPECIES: hypothetical protein [Dietzia]MBC7307528.1 hypothetical protein [Dietzia sp.]MCZ4654671.1 hypothetical protein [Dietzia kunjamensis]MDJ0421488.1 hypothetical protein [Dietzia kunjamensis]MDN4504922.1 hypothetical protein [Dietzia maris]MDV3356488.1 hypothetical protein [Dietzia sp. IN118]
MDGGANEDVRGEAARLRRRLGVARGRLDALLQAAGDPGTGGVGDAAGGDSAARGGLARIDDDDEVRALLRPAADRIARLLELTDGLADGTLSEASAGDAARAVADTQPFRRPR